MASDIASAVFSPAVRSKLLAKLNSQSPGESGSLTSLYADLIRLRLAREEFTTAIVGYVKVTDGKENTFIKDAAYYHLGISTSNLLQELRALQYSSLLMNLGLSPDTEVFDRTMTRYFSAKGDLLSEILENPSYMGLSSSQLHAISSQAVENGELLNASIDELGAVLSKHGVSLRY